MADIVAERREDGRPGSRFDELRALLVGPERRELAELQTHLFDEAVHARDVSRVLPDAIAMRAEDPRLGAALGPMIEGAITSSVRRNPQPLADALFPVMGPAIRKAIQHTLASMMESLNRTVEESFSWKALRWRWTAWRTGRPYGEIVLLHTLAYRVERAFLIHAESGLLLQQVSADAAAGADADQVSAMLTAIRDFARDSFAVDGSESLDAFRLGDLYVLVEQGPRAILAAVVRGTPPPSVRAVLQDTVGAIHRQFGAELDAYKGDSAPFERARPMLESCLLAQRREPGRRASPWRLAVPVALVLLAIGVWAFLGWRERQRFETFVERLSAEPGFVVVSSGRRGGRFFVNGLRDPLARDATALLAGLDLAPAAIDARFEPYQALAPEFVAARARDLLRPPDDVRLEYRDGVLTSHGPAPARWIADGERWGPAIAGVRRFVHEGPRPEESYAVRLQQLAVLFPKGESTVSPAQEAIVADMAALLTSLDEALRIAGRRATVELWGFTDTDGPGSLNLPLSRARADAVLARLPAGLAAIDLAATGRGTAADVQRETTETEKERNRRVSVRVRFADATGGGDR